MKSDSITELNTFFVIYSKKCFLENSHGNENEKEAQSFCKWEWLCCMRVLCEGVSAKCHWSLERNLFAWLGLLCFFIPLKSKWFRYGFLIFFFLMFFQMLWNTGLVFAGAKDLGQVVTLLWTFKLPWHWAYHGTVFHQGVAQFAFGFYSVMLKSTVLGLVTMVLFKPRSWCVYCPMGTMTQLICKAKNRGKEE